MKLSNREIQNGMRSADTKEDRRPKRKGQKSTSKLTTEQANEVRSSTEKSIDLAAKYKVHPSLISRIKTGRTHNKKPSK
tara:strand:- start:729 stop:965 length:237 start_codon:yes stop_codon:yes gene_type:complete